MAPLGDRRLASILSILIFKQVIPQPDPLFVIHERCLLFCIKHHDEDCVGIPWTRFASGWYGG